MDLKGVPVKVVWHTILFVENIQPVRHYPYDMEPRLAKLVKEELQMLIDVGFIYPIKYTDWISPIVFTKMKNGKIRVGIDLKKVNAVAWCDYFPLPFTGYMLESIASKEAYNFLDGFFRYTQ